MFSTVTLRCVLMHVVYVVVYRDASGIRGGMGGGSYIGMLFERGQKRNMGKFVCSEVTVQGVSLLFVCEPGNGPLCCEV